MYHFMYTSSTTRLLEHVGPQTKLLWHKKDMNIVNLGSWDRQIGRVGIGALLRRPRWPLFRPKSSSFPRKTSYRTPNALLQIHKPIFGVLVPSRPSLLRSESILASKNVFKVPKSSKFFMFRRTFLSPTMNRGKMIEGNTRCPEHLLTLLNGWLALVGAQCAVGHVEQQNMWFSWSSVRGGVR